MAIPTRAIAPVPAAPVNQTTKKVVFGSIEQPKGQRVLLYGTGGIGKTTLACQAPGPVAFIDADESLSILRGQLKEQNIKLPYPVNCSDWKSAREAVQSDGWDSIKTIVIDTATKLEELAVAHTLQTVKKEGGTMASSVEDYGYGKGYSFVFDTFLTILGDLDRHVRAGRNVILIAHDCTSNVPNPNGEDWIRYEPRLQSPNSGKASIRHRLKEWCDHVLFLGYDVAVDDGKAKGSGTRTLYTAERPTFMAKSRTTGENFDVVLGNEIWSNILK